MFRRSKTVPVPSELRASTGCTKGWKESAQQSNGTCEAGRALSAFLRGYVSERPGKAGRNSLLVARRGAVLAESAGVFGVSDV